MKFNAAVVQMNSSNDVDFNLAQAENFIADAAEKNAKLIVLPENFAFIGKTDTDKLTIAEDFGQGKIQTFLAAQAKKHKIYLVGGSIALRAENDKKVYNASLIFNDHGDCIARYNKIHLFDVTVSSIKETYQESSTIAPGKDFIVFDSPFGKIGLAICYDIRFPELFRALSLHGAEIIAIPTAFTQKTGEAHWEVLTRARAIENFCYVLGSCQTGIHGNNRKTFGHSLIIGPWGEILAILPEKNGAIVSEIDLELLHQIRKDFPVHQHRKIN